MAKPFRIAIAGLGTVGVGVVNILTKNAKIISARAGRDIEIIAVSSRNKEKDRGVDLSSYDWVDNTADLASYEGVDAIIELIGGSEGVAADLVKQSLSNNKHVVTANKALVAHHGYNLAKISEKNEVSLAYEAAVAGGIPIIKAMREGFTANEMRAVHGILNGTCNYILTQMREEGRDFADVLKDAQKLGYAESDPSFDVGGVDAAHKLCILTAIAFGVKPNFDAMEIQGIEHINATDISYASDFGYRIKLLGVARKIDNKIMQIVEPCLVPINSPLGGIEDVYNAVFVEGDFVETPLLTGLGAGQDATASSVVADIIDLARGLKVPTFGVPASQLKNAKYIDMGKMINRYYLRLNVLDKPGVIADISAILRDKDISIEGMVQRARAPGQSVPIVITTHEVKHDDMLGAIKLIESLDACMQKPCLMTIEEL